MRRLDPRDVARVFGVPWRLIVGRKEIRRQRYLRLMARRRKVSTQATTVRVGLLCASCHSIETGRR